MQVRNLDEIRARDPKLYEALIDIINGSGTIAQQVNGNPNGQPSAPPQINGLQVTAQDGFAHVSISDENQIYRGIRYYVEHADNPNFTNPQVVPMVDSRNTVVPIGKGIRYFRAYSAYSSSGPSAAVYHGDASQPIAVSGGGSFEVPFASAQGSGTGAAETGLSGPGPIPFRSPTGVPPVR